MKNVNDYYKCKVSKRSDSISSCISNIYLRNEIEAFIELNKVVEEKIKELNKTLKQIQGFEYKVHYTV